jgi:hypothetical protein
MRQKHGGTTSSAPTRVLIVAHRTAATPRLLAEVRARARRSPCSFTLLVPRPYWDPDTEQAADTLSTLPARVSHWLRRDLPHRVEAFGLPVVVVTAEQSERAVFDAR